MLWSHPIGVERTSRIQGEKYSKHKEGHFCNDEGSFKRENITSWVYMHLITESKNGTEPKGEIGKWQF